ncbi:MAG TPA: ribokinase [Capsulimonadaceae bacterium]|jgi:ribokinase
MKQPKVVVVGSTNTDMVFRSQRVPEAGETILGGTFAMVAGGKGANQAVAAARLGAAVTFVAKVGRDSLGEQAVAAFQADGIDTSYIAVDDTASSGVAAILVDDVTGQNRIIVASGANAALTVADVEAASTAIRTADIVVCQLEVPLDAVVAALTIAHGAGVPTILNPAPAMALPAAIFPLVTYITPNEIEAGQMLEGTGCDVPASDYTACAAIIRSLGVETVITTLGGDGAYILTSAGPAKVEGRRVKEVVDTTAAGDCFTGALATALAEQRTLADAIDFANRAAAISVTRAGAQPSLPSRFEVDASR